MLFVYINDILALSHRTRNAIKEITEFYRAKEEGSVKPPEIYLGVNISKMQLLDGRKVWTTSPKAYIKNSLLIFEQLLNEDRDKCVLQLNVKNPFPTGYKPKIDITDELGQALASRYKQLIGIL
jgi:hypothetical protein